MKIVLTCEHAGNKIPKKYQHLFTNAKSTLNSHHGYDFGAVKIFKSLTKYSDFNNYTTISRLLIDLNRSIGNKILFSDYTKTLNKKEKEEISNKYYSPYRNKVEQFIFNNIRKKIIHFSIHSFTPVLNNKKRNADIGILYDPKNKKEKLLADKIKSKIKLNSPNLNIRFNYPYLGKSDGFTTYLRKKYSYDKYSGIEIELNQKLFKNVKVINKVIQSFKEIIIELK